MSKINISHQADLTLIWSVAILVFLGFLMLLSASAPLSYEKTQINNDPATGNPTYYLFRQILYGLLGIILAFFFSKFSLNFLKNIVTLFYILSIIFLTLVFIPSIGVEAGGAARWLQIGDFTLQPSEFAKLALILYLAALFEKKIKEKEFKDLKKGFLSFLIVLAPFVILILMQPDMGTLGTLCLIALLMFFGMGASFSHIFIAICLGIIFLLGAIFIFDYQAERVTTFLNPEEDTSDSAYQINQSLIALGSGGIVGVGFTNGIQKWSYLPQPMNDTIFASWGEETGFIGTLSILILYLIICWRGFIIARKAPDDFSKGLALGITGWIGIQSFLHIMAVCGLIPFTGIPLPFISYGGSALVFNLMAVGILINVSRKTV